MKKLNILSLVICAIFFQLAGINHAFSAVHFISKADNVSISQPEKPCLLKGYTYTSNNCKDGKTLYDKCPTGDYYKTCKCNETNYPFTKDTCKDGKVLAGKSCGENFEKCECDLNIYQYYTGGKECEKPKVPDYTDSCLTKNGTPAAKKCACPKEYSQTCSGNLEGVGTPCDGKYTSCRCKSNFKSCNYGKAPGAQTCEYGGEKKYDNCLQPTCEDGGYISDPKGAQCTTFSYGGKTCYKDCVLKLTCQEWVKANHPDKFAYTYFQDTTTSGGYISFYGPKAYDYDECQKMTTPTITVSSQILADLHVNRVLVIDSVNIKFTNALKNKNGSCVTTTQMCTSMYNGYKSYCGYSCKSETDYLTECYGTNQSHYSMSDCVYNPSSDSCCAHNAAISIVSTNTNEAIIKDATIEAPINAVVINNNGVNSSTNGATLRLKGNVNIKPSGTVNYFRGIYIRGDYNSTKAQCLVESGANVTVTNGGTDQGTIYVYYNGLFSIAANAKVTTPSVMINQSGFTPTYYAHNGIHVYGTLNATDATHFWGGQVNTYSGSKFKTSKMTWTGVFVGGRLKYNSGSEILINGTCRRATSNGQYDMPKNSTITTNPVSGSSCTAW